MLKQENEESGWMWRSFVEIVVVSFVGPLIAIIPFVLKVTDDCVDSLIGHSLWIGGTVHGVFLVISRIFVTQLTFNSCSCRFYTRYSGKCSFELYISFDSFWVPHSSILHLLCDFEYFLHICVSTSIE